MTTTTRRMVYAQIANAVLAGLPEPESQSLNADGADGPYLFLNFDSHDDARLWARWLSPSCVESERWDEHEPTHTRSVWYWGERPGDEGGWGWNIIGREQSLAELVAEANRVIAAEREDFLGSYTTAHARVRRARGPASRFACVDCGGSAEGWALSHERVGERVQRDPRPFSLDPADYDPRCVKCHHHYDVAHGKDNRRTWAAPWGRSRRSGSTSSPAVDGNDRPTVEQVTIAALAPDSLRVPCGRCGHDENIHQYDTASNANQYGDVDPAGHRLCLDCKGFCSPIVLVPAGVEGWGIQGRSS